MNRYPDPFHFESCGPTSGELCKALVDLGDGAAAAAEHLARFPTRDGCAHLIAKLARLERHLHALRNALEREEAPKED
ncbi:hypothetical protein [Lysobacter antibioticus]|uniref:hypothetical protein n=1 Tax=Lysobacter antibioticus TaxID=84531 RepID=UPI0007E8C497|nr:hypothetical protein [Lysobacter antibioticus]